MTTKPSPLRKIIPPLVWPAGILLLVGYCYVGARMEERRIPPEARVEMREAARARAPGAGDIVVDGAQVHSVAVALDPAQGFSGSISIVVILGVVLAVVVVLRTNAKDKAERQRAADEAP